MRISPRKLAVFSGDRYQTDENELRGPWPHTELAVNPRLRPRTRRWWRQLTRRASPPPRLTLSRGRLQSGHVKPDDPQVRPQLNAEEVRRIVERLNHGLKPRRILVFGSYARGDWRPGSDLDLFIEMETDLPPHQRRLLARRVMGPKKCPVDVLVYTPAEVAARRDSPGSIIPTILSEGREVA